MVITKIDRPASHFSALKKLNFFNLPTNKELWNTFTRLRKRGVFYSDVVGLLASEEHALRFLDAVGTRNRRVGEEVVVPEERVLPGLAVRSSGLGLRDGLEPRPIHQVAHHLGGYEADSRGWTP